MERLTGALILGVTNCCVELLCIQKKASEVQNLRKLFKPFPEWRQATTPGMLFIYHGDCRLPGSNRCPNEPDLPTFPLSELELAATCAFQATHLGLRVFRPQTFYGNPVYMGRSALFQLPLENGSYTGDCELFRGSCCGTLEQVTFVRDYSQ